MAEPLPRCIYLAGADGSGKTTQAQAMLAWLAGQGVRARYVWLRFPRLFCTPFLVYARLRGYSYQETVGEQRYGYWEFGASWLMRTVFPWVLLADTFLLALVRIYLPLARGYTVVCDRFVADVLVDLMLGEGQRELDRGLPGRLFLALLPPGVCTVIIDLGTATALQRTPALQGDRTRSARRNLYLELAARRRWPVVSSEPPREVVAAQLMALFNDPSAAVAGAIAGTAGDRPCGKVDPQDGAVSDRSRQQIAWDRPKEGCAAARSVVEDVPGQGRKPYPSVDRPAGH